MTGIFRRRNLVSRRMRVTHTWLCLAVEVKSGEECVEISEDNAPEGLDTIPVIAARMVHLPKAPLDSAAEPHDLEELV